MTSEVVVLNKKGIIVAADSAVTTGVFNASHPRYSKAANKIFDISPQGNVAITIFGAAEIDQVPWELALKLFRSSLQGSEPLPRLHDYVSAVIAFLKGNASIFPEPKVLTAGRFPHALLHVIRSAGRLQPPFLDTDASEPDRIAAWNLAEVQLKQRFEQSAVHPSLNADDLGAALNDLGSYVAIANAELENSPLKDIISQREEVTKLALSALFKEPTQFLSHTGVVAAGYGGGEIFPSYQCAHVYGHVGSSLLYEMPDYLSRAITHSTASWIQAFAQSSMIDVFTDGFGFSLQSIIREKSQEKLDLLIEKLRGEGVPIPSEVADPIVKNIHDEFMGEWQQKNYAVNFAPLRTVLAGLSIQEMSHLAETLLTLESLKERVTSPTESVGGPIDIAAITKSEGLVWIKRKHYFEPELNLRYTRRVQSSSS
ncbi:MAG: hypothetical protein O9318_13240 [Hylemonella sp.]|uniref:hypothetical protein n=1 Tax=Hylemonella sp. TaxID=2066020 RepID=UPI0022C8FD72|nr:hypothetical protein [Hylemonella sp.]MCZ8253430.1 hypothetical protein [Hylemonella sp.]